MTIIEAPNSGSYLLPYWRNICDDNNSNGKIQSFIESSKTNSLTGFSGATLLPPLVNSFMYIETSSNNHGPKVFVSWKRTDIKKISKKTFYYNRFSFLTNDCLKSVGRFRIQLLLSSLTWSTRYNIPKNDR